MKENDFTHKPLLTKREREVFELLVQDKTTKEIASELFISEKTVRNHISNAMHMNCKENQSEARSASGWFRYTPPYLFLRRLPLHRFCSIGLITDAFS